MGWRGVRALALLGMGLLALPASARTCDPGTFGAKADGRTKDTRAIQAAIDYAIAHKLKRVEAGGQGAHQLPRGYLPTTTFSAHFIANPALKRAIDEYLVRERHYVEAAREELAGYAPFRKDLVEQE